MESGGREFEWKKYESCLLQYKHRYIFSIQLSVLCNTGEFDSDGRVEYGIIRKENVDYNYFYAIRIQSSFDSRGKARRTLLTPEDSTDRLKVLFKLS